MRKLPLVLGTAALVMAAGAPALGATSSDTTLTVSLVGGALSIAAPTTAALSGNAAAGSVVNGTLGSTATTVSDARGSLLGWTVSVVTDGDLKSAAAPEDTVPLTAAGPLIIAAGTVTASGTSLLSGVAAGTAGGLSATSLPLVTAALGAGGGTYTYTPTLVLTVPPNTKAHSDYTVKVTQSIA